MYTILAKKSNMIYFNALVSWKGIKWKYLIYSKKDQKKGTLFNTICNKFKNYFKLRERIWFPVQLKQLSFLNNYANPRH